MACISQNGPFALTPLQYTTAGPMSRAERQKLIPQVGASTEASRNDPNTSLLDVELPARTCFGARVFMPQQSVWFISIFWIIQAISMIVLSTIILVSYVQKHALHPDVVRREHMACSTVIIINYSLSLFYIVHGIFKQRREDLICFTITVCIASTATLFDFFVHGDQLRAVHVVRCALGVVCLPFDVFAVLYILQSPAWQYQRHLDTERKRLRSAFFACQKLVFQFVLVLVSILEISEATSRTDQWMTGALALLTIASVLLGWRGASFHNRSQILVTVLLTVPFDVLVVVLLSLRGHHWLHASPHAYKASIVFGAAIVLLNVCSASLLLRLSKSADRSGPPPSRYTASTNAPSFLDFGSIDPVLTTKPSPQVQRSARVSIIRSQSTTSPIPSVPNSFL